MPATSSTKPSAPASTTFARRSISSWLRVSSSELRAVASAFRNSVRKSRDARGVHRAVDGRGEVRSTVRIVPSRGSVSDSRA